METTLFVAGTTENGSQVVDREATYDAGPEGIMVLTKAELLAALQNEVRVLLHLASKIDRSKLDYRPTPKQRSTLELLRYLSVMGPRWLQFAKAGYDAEGWTAADQAAEARDFDRLSRS